MKVSELIKTLTELKDKEGDLEVYLEDGHGEQTAKSNWVGVSYIDDAASYMPETIHEDDLEEWEEPVKVIQIQGY